MLVAKVIAHTAIQFIWGIISRFGVPNRIITDNGTQFTSRSSMEYFEELGIRLCFASIAHPRSNAQVERANGLLLWGLMARTFNKLEKHGQKMGE